MGLLWHIVCFATDNMPAHAGPFNHIILISLSISWGSLRDEVSFLNDARREEASDNLRSLIKLKFGEVPDWVESRVEQADHGQLKAWMDKVLFADSLDEMFKQ